MVEVPAPEPDLSRELLKGREEERNRERKSVKATEREREEKKMLRTIC